MISVDVTPIYDLGNAWITMGNTLFQQMLNLQTGVMQDIVWSGVGGDAMREVWGNGTDQEGALEGQANPAAPTALHGMWAQTANSAWKMGEAINAYADKIKAAVQAYNKNQLVSIIVDVLGFALGSVVGFAVGPLLDVLVGVLGEVATWVANVVSKLAPALAQAATNAGLALGTEIAQVAQNVAILGLDAALQSGGQVGAGIISQLVADGITHTPVQIDPKSVGINAGLGLLGVGNPFRGAPKGLGDVDGGGANALDSNLPTPNPTKVPLATDVPLTNVPRIPLNAPGAKVASPGSAV